MRSIAMLVLMSLPAQAGEWHLDVQGVTDIPVQVGVVARMEGPKRLRLGTSLGILPGPYVDLINASVVALGGYDQQTADLIREALQNSLVWRIRLGWRPLEDWGWFLAGGYTLVALGGGAAGEELVAVATGIPPPQDGPREQAPYQLGALLHLLDVEVGWEWELVPALVLRASLGFSATLASAARVVPDFQVPFPALNQVFCDAAENYLENIFTSYVHMPVVSLGLGYRFF